MLSLIVAAVISQAPTGLTRDIPAASWVSIFFGTEADPQSIRGRTKLSKLPDLQAGRLPSGVTEIRIWEGFGITYLEGYRFRQEFGKWRGWWLLPAIAEKKDWKAKNFLQEFKEPKPSWPGFVQTLVKDGIKDLPDFESLPGEKGTILDGVSYVVEFSSLGKYRTYMYNNPAMQKGDWSELAKMKQLVKDLHSAFRDQTAR